MLKVAIVDANQTAISAEKFIDHVVSVVGHWLKYEMDHVSMPLSDPSEADLVFLVHSGSVDFTKACKTALGKHKIKYDQKTRRAKPYIITGGAVDATPFTALSIADALAIGEAYLYVRQILDIVKDGGSIRDVDTFTELYDHALTAKQCSGFKRDKLRPYLFERPFETPLAMPDDYVDWENTPLIRSPDKVVRMVVSKGCHLKCKFCATTYRQTYRINTDERAVQTAIQKMARNKERFSFVTNDVADLPYFNMIPKYGSIDNQSLTIKAIRDDEKLQSLIDSKIKIARFGVEGISERIRTAFGKPISNEELIQRLGYLHDNGVNTHMFYIAGSPYETVEDWDNFKLFYEQLAKRVRNGLARIKFTTFAPNAPAPLAYFVPSSEYYQHMNDTMVWIAQNWANRHLMAVKGRQPKTRISDISDQYTVSRQYAASLMLDDRTNDLAPSMEDAYRFGWEVIAWPLATKKRWLLARSYKKHMGISD